MATSVPRVAALSNFDRDHIVWKPEIFAVVLFTEFADFFFTGVSKGSELLCYKGCDGLYIRSFI